MAIDNEMIKLLFFWYLFLTIEQRANMVQGAIWSVSKVLSPFHDRFDLVISLELFRDDFIPKPIVVIIECDWQFGTMVLIFEMFLWRLGEGLFVLLDHRSSLELFSLDFGKLNKDQTVRNL